MPPIVRLSDRLWLNLDHVVLVRRRDDGDWEVEVSSTDVAEECRLDLTGPEVERLLHYLDAGPPEDASGDGRVERWRIVEGPP